MQVFGLIRRGMMEVHEVRIPQKVVAIKDHFGT
jgi:hypothetical protein